MVVCENLTFGQAMDKIRDSKTMGMRLPHWSEDVVIRVQHPNSRSKMTAPYLYVQSRYGRVPWKETMIELFSKEWTVVDDADEQGQEPGVSSKRTPPNRKKTR